MAKKKTPKTALTKKNMSKGTKVPLPPNTEKADTSEVTGGGRGVLEVLATGAGIASSEKLCAEKEKATIINHTISHQHAAIAHLKCEQVQNLTLTAFDLASRTQEVVRLEESLKVTSENYAIQTKVVEELRAEVRGLEVETRVQQLEVERLSITRTSL